ncbi:MAG: hypothetical protein ACQER1_16405 [Armatimonadota bacterium]
MRLSVLILVPLLLISLAATAAAQEDAEEPEEEPYDERGFIRDDIRLSLSFTRGSTDRYDYEDLRIYLSGEAHYAFKGDDYLDMYLLVNRLDRDYDEERYERDDPIRDILDFDLTYVFGGVDKWTPGDFPVVGATLFSTDGFDNIDLGVGYGRVWDYDGGVLRAMAGAGQNLGYSDSWAPLADLSWIHNFPMGNRWRLRTKADLMWKANRGDADLDGETRPETIYVLDGTLSYQIQKGWSLSLRYFNDNGSDRPRSYTSLGVTHRFRAPRPRR